jgi:hypothetical protein
MKKGGSVVPMGLLRMALVAILVLACMPKMLVPKDKGERRGEGEGVGVGMAEGEGVVEGEDVVKIDVMLHGVRLLLRHGFMIHASLTIRTCKKKFSNLPQLYRTITMISCNSLVPSQDLLLVLNPKIRPSLRLDIILFLIWLRLVEPTFSNQKIL